MKHYQLMLNADLMDIGITRPYELMEQIIRELPKKQGRSKKGATQQTEVHEQRIIQVTEQCAIDACIRAGEQLGLQREILILEYAIKSLKHTIAGTGSTIKSSECGKPFEQVCIAKLCTPSFGGKLLSEMDIFKKATLNYGENFLHKIIWNAKNFGTTEALFNCDTLTYFERVAKAKLESDKAALANLVEFAIMPENEFHNDMFMIHMVENGDTIELYMESWSFKFKQTVDIKKSVLSTALDKVYVDNYKKESKQWIMTEKSDKFHELVLGEKELLTGHLRVHVHATVNEVNSDFKEEIYGKVKLPESQVTCSINFKDLKYLLDKRSLYLVERCVFEGHQSQSLKKGKEKQRTKVSKKRAKRFHKDNDDDEEEDSED
jgi:hypothetical protein